MKKVLYDLYNRGEMILTAVNANEVKAYLGNYNLNVSKYVLQGSLYKGEYLIVQTGTEVINFEVEWEKAVAPFRRVQWVKSGGRKLKIGGDV